MVQTKPKNLCMTIIKYNVVTAGTPYHETGVVNHHLTQRPFADIPASPAIAGDLQHPIAEPRDEDVSLESRLNQSSSPPSTDRLRCPQAPRNTGGHPPDDQKGYKDHALLTAAGAGAIIARIAPAGSMFGASLGSGEPFAMERRGVRDIPLRRIFAIEHFTGHIPVVKEHDLPVLSELRGAFEAAPIYTNSDPSNALNGYG